MMKKLMSIMQIILTILNFEKDVYEKTFTKNKKLKKEILVLQVLSSLATISIAGLFFILLKLRKIHRIKKTNLVEPIKNKKWRKILIYLLIFCTILFIISISLILTLD